MGESANFRERKQFEDNPYYYSLCNILCTNIMTHARTSKARRQRHAK